MRILLLSPPYLPEYMRNGRCDYFSISNSRWYPIWLSYCGALLEQRGHYVKLIDAPSEGMNYKSVFKKVLEFFPDIVVIYSSTKSQESDIMFSEKIKGVTRCYMVFVGPYVSVCPEEILGKSEKIDAVVKGEFEYPVLDIANEKEKEKIKNLVWKKNRDIFTNETRGPLNREELDSLPFVTGFYRKHLNIRNYRIPSQLYPFVDLFTGRGCWWGKCVFCLWPQTFIKGSVYNTRSVKNVIEELSFVKKEMPHVKEVFFQDDSLPEKRAIELSNAMLGRGLKMTWSCYARGNLSYRTLKLMKESGCRTLHVGYESKNNDILRSIGKGLTSEEMADFTISARTAGLKIHGDFLFGLPGETEETLHSTIKWSKELNPDTAQFLTPNLYKNTSLYNLPIDNSSMLPEGALKKYVKKAYKEFYIRKAFIKKALTNPEEYIFSQIRAIHKVFTNIF